MANFSGLAIALQRLGNAIGVDVAQQGVSALGRVHVLSGEPHASIRKAAAMLGLGRNAVERLPQEPDRERVDVELLTRRLGELRDKPVIVVGNAGTVTTGDFDNLNALGRAARSHGAHFHIDAAFGIFAALSRRHSHLLDGVDLADTIAADAHKCLNVPFDSGFIFTRHREAQMEMFKSVSAYLPQASLQTFNPQHLGPETSRRFRALPAWVTVRAYGRDGYGEFVERCASYADELGKRLLREPGFRCVTPVRFNIVCFSLTGAEGPFSEEKTRAFVRRVADDGRVFVTQSSFKGAPCVRAALLNWRTCAHDLDVAIEALRDCRRELL